MSKTKLSVPKTADEADAAVVVRVGSEGTLSVLVGGEERVMRLAISDQAGELRLVAVQAS